MLFSITDHKLKLFTRYQLYANLFKIPNNLTYTLGTLILCHENSSVVSRLPHIALPLATKGTPKQNFWKWPFNKVIKPNSGKNFHSRSIPWLQWGPEVNHALNSIFFQFCDYRDSINRFSDSTTQSDGLSFNAVAAKWGDFAPPPRDGHLVMPGDSVDCHTWWRCHWHLGGRG